tara:strand:- start:3266 stop:4267 length:1002 start_codon:yes stop_codon:yes gene_type:complete
MKNQLHFSKTNALENGLCILSHGMGQDSTTITYKLFTDADFRARTLDGRSLVIVFSDTGNERSDVYDHAWKIQDLCKAFGVLFVHLAGSDTIEMHQLKGRDTSHINGGFHTEAWSSLVAMYMRNHCLAIRNSKSCTDNLKIKPIYRWLNAFCADLLGVEKERSHGKRDLVELAEKTRPIKMMIGFAVGEESRMKKASKPGKQAWWQSVEKTFPLITDLAFNRADCIDFMQSTQWGACGPSMCKFCPNITKQTLVLMWLENRSYFIAWVRHERNKLNKWGAAQAEKEANNTGALGRNKNLIEELRLALAEFSDWSLEDLKEYDFRNGHCISNGY